MFFIMKIPLKTSSLTDHKTTHLEHKSMRTKTLKLMINSILILIKNLMLLNNSTVMARQNPLKIITKIPKRRNKRIRCKDSKLKSQVFF